MPNGTGARRPKVSSPRCYPAARPHGSMRGSRRVRTQVHASSPPRGRPPPRGARGATPSRRRLSHASFSVHSSRNAASRAGPATRTGAPARRSEQRWRPAPARRGRGLGFRCRGRSAWPTPPRPPSRRWLSARRTPASAGTSGGPSSAAVRDQSRASPPAWPPAAAQQHPPGEEFGAALGRADASEPVPLGGGQQR